MKYITTTKIKFIDILKLCMVILCLPACGHGKADQHSTKPVVANYSLDNTTELTLDSLGIIKFFKTFPASDSNKKVDSLFSQPVNHFRFPCVQ